MRELCAHLAWVLAWTMAGLVGSAYVLLATALIFLPKLTGTLFLLLVPCVHVAAGMLLEARSRDLAETSRSQARRLLLRILVPLSLLAQCAVCGRAGGFPP